MEMPQETELFNLENKIRIMISDLIAPILKKASEQDDVLNKLVSQTKKNKEKIHDVDRSLDKSLLKMVPLDAYNKKSIETNAEIKSLEGLLNKKLEGFQSSLNNITNKFEYTKAMIKSLEDTQKYQRESDVIKEKSFGEFKENIMIDLSKIESMLKKQSYENFNSLEKIQSKIEKISFACNELTEKSIHSLHFFLKQSNESHNKLDTKVNDLIKDRISKKDMAELKKKIENDISVNKSKLKRELKEINTYIDKVLKFQISSEIFENFGNALEEKQLKKLIPKINEQLHKSFKLIEESKNPSSENYQLPAMSLSQLIFQKNSFEALVKSYKEKIVQYETNHAKKIEMFEATKIEPIKSINQKVISTKIAESPEIKTDLNKSVVTEKIIVPKGIEKLKITSSDHIKPILQYEKEKNPPKEEISFGENKTNNVEKAKFIDRLKAEQEKYFPSKKEAESQENEIYETKQDEYKEKKPKKSGQSPKHQEKIGANENLKQNKQGKSESPSKKRLEKSRNIEKPKKPVQGAEFFSPIPPIDESLLESTPPKSEVSVMNDVNQTPYFINTSDPNNTESESSQSPKSNLTSIQSSLIPSPISSQNLNPLKLSPVGFPASSFSIYPSSITHEKSAESSQISEINSNVVSSTEFYPKTLLNSSPPYQEIQKLSEPISESNESADFSQALSSAHKAISEASANFTSYIAVQSQEMNSKISMFVQSEIEKLQRARDESILAVIESTQSMREKLYQDQEELRINLKLIHDENKHLMKQRANDVSRFDSELKKLNVVVDNHENEILNTKEEVSNINNCLEGIRESQKIVCALLKQDEDDRELIQLSVMTENKSFVKPKLAISLKPECLSCTGQSSTIYSAFKVACLNYTPSEVLYSQKLYPRKSLINLLNEYVKDLKDFSQLIHSINYSATSLVRDESLKKNKSKTPRISSRFLLNNTAAVSKIFSDKDISPPPLRRQ